MRGLFVGSVSADEMEGLVKPTARTVRVVFGVTLLWICLLQYAVFALGRAEPYPALVLPGFPARCPGCLLETGVPRTEEPTLLVRFADGDTEEIPPAAILPPGPSVRLLAFTDAFKDDSKVAANPNAVAWLQRRVEQRFPTEAVTGLDIVWREATYEAASKASVKYAPLYTVHVDFGGGR
jgi:hypothetical protein